MDLATFRADPSSASIVMDDEEARDAAMRMLGLRKRSLICYITSWSLDHSIVEVYLRLVRDSYKIVLSVEGSPRRFTLLSYEYVD